MIGLETALTFASTKLFWSTPHTCDWLGFVKLCGLDTPKLGWTVVFTKVYVYSATYF
jgi:hypothetical protein